MLFSFVFSNSLGCNAFFWRHVDYSVFVMSHSTVLFFVDVLLDSLCARMSTSSPYHTNILLENESLVTSLHSMVSTHQIVYLMPMSLLICSPYSSTLMRTSPWSWVMVARKISSKLAAIVRRVHTVIVNHLVDRLTVGYQP